MFGHTYFHDSIRKYVAVFGTLFNDIHILRKEADDSTNAILKVPISYAPKEKVLVRLKEDPNLDRDRKSVV